MSTIKTQPLTRDTFEPFGDVLEKTGASSFIINNGTTTRYHDLADVQLLGNGARAMMSFFCGSAFEFPLSIKMLERHPLGSQAFVPLQQKNFLIVVAEDNGGKPGAISAFITTAGQGVNYHANIWHHPLICLENPQDFLVVDRGGEGANLEEYFYDTPVQITL